VQEKRKVTALLLFTNQPTVHVDEREETSNHDRVMPGMKLSHF